MTKKHLTQFGRAMQQLGIEMIAAYSPEARGRSERMFGTLQGRLPIRHSYAKAKIRVHEYADGGLGLFYGHRCLGRI